MTLLSAAILLFLVMDPIGNVPVLVSTLAPVAPERRRLIVVRELVIALVVLVAFLFLGPRLLAVLGISEPSLGIAGGIILFLIALRMIFPTMGGSTTEGEETGEPFVVPLAIPLIAGPSAMASVMLLVSREPARWPVWLGALLAAWAASGVVLLAANGLAHRLGRRGLVAVERLMGMVLTAVAVEMFMRGARAFLAG